MSKIKALDELREYAEQCCPEYEDYDARMIEIADAIEAEIESRYMLLPVDADGVSIRCGDEVTTDALFNEKWSVFAVASDYWVDIDGYTHNLCTTHHVNPRTIEDVLCEYGKRCCARMTSNNNGTDDQLITKYAAEICRVIENDMS